ncbi:type II secretion system protein N [Geomonas subterranea]|uniref:General secretion pathway protein GspC n=1 Tax=Geomonas subterranea TaxID=2847989 RepID=A0ABX8LIK7_9BACT|nr:MULTISPECIES: type II secretion system protein N [Geomonas]QXE89415.1 general secretion pathway protein GspC [Geomonas subterranea]QXM08469.1 general secretion pathway protein GspC [Geomonas subterranea]
MPRWILPLNLTLGLAITAVAALIAADLLSVKIAALYPRNAQKQVAAQVAAAPAGSQDLLSFAPILERGLFGRATQGKLTALQQQGGAPATAAAPPPASVGDLVLLGTAVGSFRETFALVLKNSTHEERVFRLGDTVFSAGPLVAVKKDVAEILIGGKRVKILTPMAAAAEAAAPAVAPAGVAGGAGLAAPAGGGNYVIDQRALNAALDNIGQAMTDARLLPSMKEGKVEGFRASEVKPQGIFGTVGIKNGDVLLRMNDFPIDSPEKAIQSFASLKGQSRIKLDLIRDGRPTTFTYDIR